MLHPSSRFPRQREPTMGSHLTAASVPTRLLCQTGCQAREGTAHNLSRCPVAPNVSRRNLSKPLCRASEDTMKPWSGCEEDN